MPPTDSINKGGSDPSPVQQKNKHQLVWEENHPQPPTGCWGTRHFVTLMLALGMANAYTMRTNMSVAIVTMVNHTALRLLEIEDSSSGHNDVESSNVTIITCGFESSNGANNESEREDGNYVWNEQWQGYILGSFFSGYVFTQIPFGILAKSFGSRLFLGYGMLFNSVCGLLVPLAARIGDKWGLMFIRFLQGLGEGPIVPCCHAMLAKWIPPNERSRMAAIVYSGAQFGTIISMPLSGILSDKKYGGWPTIFYFFGALSLAWSIWFIMSIYENPDVHPTMDKDEKKFIMDSLGAVSNEKAPPTPWMSILTSLPFWAVMAAHLGHNFGYETLMTELPTFMNQILRFDIKKNGFLSSVPYLAMWTFSYASSWIADHFISKGTPRSRVRKIAQAIGHYGPAVCLILISMNLCGDPPLTVALFTIGLGLNGAIYSGFKVSHLDLSPTFAGILMALTNCSANVMGLAAAPLAGTIIKSPDKVNAWKMVFLISAAVYIVCNTFYMVFARSERQPWDSSGSCKPGTREAVTLLEQTDKKDTKDSVHNNTKDTVVH